MSSQEKGSEVSGMSARGATVLFGAACFLSGASLMIIEITGNRLLAPVFGNSLYTWTALIGVVLVAFSAGGYFGGWLVDKSPQPAVLAMVLFAAAIATILIPPIYYLVDGPISGMGLVAGPTLLSLLLFMVPGCLLGSVTPFTIRLLSMAGEDRHIGRAAGVIGMLGSLGSFVGTFASGFYLIPAFGARQIFVFTAVVLLFAGGAVILRFRAGFTKSIAMMLLGVVVMSGALFLAVSPGARDGSVWRKLTFYHSIEVFDQPEGAGRTARYLQLDTTTEGGQILETGEIVVGYQNYWMLAMPLGEGLERAAFLGAGAFAMPQHFAKHWPKAEVDVVEIDPEVIEAGYDHFRLGEYENISAHAMDARRFLAMAFQKYDFIFGDAYNGVRYIPAHLTTKEFFETVQRVLDEDGVFVMNIISGVTGEKAALFDAIRETVATVFENVEVYSSYPDNFIVPHNVMLMASDRELESFYKDLPPGVPVELHRLAETRVAPAVYRRKKGTVLTDDRNPVEHIVAQQLKL